MALSCCALCARILPLTPFPVILLSARAGEEARDEGLERGADDYLVKPFSSRELIARVNAHLTLARLRRETEERITHVMNSITDGFYAIDRNWRITGFNAAAERIFRAEGLYVQDLLGKHIFEEAFPAVRDSEVARAIGRSMKERTDITVENYYEPWKRWYFVRCYPTNDGGVATLFQDITERKSAEDVTRQMANQLALITNTAPVFIAYCDAEARYKFVNSAYAERVGLTPADCIGKRIPEIVGEEAYEKLRPYVEAVLRGEPTKFEVELSDPARGQYYMHCSYAPELDKRGKVIGLVAAIIDITQRKQAEEALREQRERFNFAAEASQIGYWFCDLPFDKLIWDARVKEHFWLPRDADVDIRLFYDRLHPEDRERTQRAIDDSIANHTRYEIEYRTVSPEGSQKWIRAIGRTAYDNDGIPLRFDGATIDITAMKQAEEALRRSEKLAAVGRLAATMAHEINNPLTSVTNLLYLLRKDPTLSDKSRRQLRIADQELDRVAHIAKQTLGFYRNTSAPQLLNPSEAIDELVTVYSYRFRNRDIKVEKELDPTAIAFAAPGEFRQVFSNLFVNAVDAISQEAGRIRIRVRKSRDWGDGGRTGVRISIADNGSGISPEHLTRIFEPFYTTKQDVGTGLGLWLSQSIVQKHNGRLRVRSSIHSRSMGTVFSVFWPDDPHPTND